MKLQRKKNYKARPPLDTVAQIRGILHDMDLLTLEEHHYNEEAGIPSCRILIAEDRLRNLQIGTNGKGMNTRYCLASGYAEFMERLQNHILLPGRGPGGPDGRTARASECPDAVRAFFVGNYGPEEKASEFFLSLDESYTLLPFCEVDGSNPTELPMELVFSLCTSNGMSAGNSRTEAILQSTSEIFERAAQTRILFDRLCPPSVPEEFFAGTEVLEKLKLLRALGVHWDVRDCSLGIGLPVIGIYMHLDDGRELFHVGADPSPITALERCVTEIFQGVDSFNDAEFHEPEDIPHDLPFWKYQMELNAFGGNIWPMEIHSGSPSWEFTGFEHPVTESDEDDLSYYLSIIRRCGKTLLVHDAGYSGFPSYFCYIPGFSPVKFCHDRGEEFVRYSKGIRSLDGLRRLPALSAAEMHDLAVSYRDFLEEFWYLEYEGWSSRIFPAGTFPAQETDFELFLARLYAAGGLREEAAEAMESFLWDSESNEIGEDFIRLMRTGKARAEETAALCRFSAEDYPCCPDCGRCGVRDFCRKADVDALAARVEEYFRAKQ